MYNTNTRINIDTETGKTNIQPDCQSLEDIVFGKGDKAITFKQPEIVDSRPIATDAPSYNYQKLMWGRITDMLNSVECKMATGECRSFRYHRKGEAPTPITAPMLSDRTVKFIDQGRLGKDGITAPVEITAKAGQMIISKPHKEGLMFSFAHELYDHECMGTVTELTLRQDIETHMQNIDHAITKHIVETLESDACTGYIKVCDPIVETNAKRLTARGEALQDAIYEAQATMNTLGTDLEDFTIALSVDLYSAAQHLAKKAGFDTVDEFYGTQVFVFNAKDASTAPYYGYLFPKRYAAVSFSEAEDGTVFKHIVTRVGERASTIVEVHAEAALMCAGFTKLDVPVNGGTGNEVDVQLPIIAKFSVSATEG